MEDKVYRTSSQYRYWSYTREQLASLREETNHYASERVRTAIRKARDAERSKDINFKQSTNKSVQVDFDGPTIETLTVQEELKLVSWFSTKIIEVGGAMEPPIPMEIRVLLPFDFAYVGSLGVQTLTMSTVYRYSIPSSFLHLELSYDLPSETNHDVCAVSGNKVRPLAHIPSQVCIENRKYD